MTVTPRNPSSNTTTASCYDIYGKQKQGSTDLGRLASALKPAMEAFAKLFEDEQFYKRVMSELAKAMYLNYRNSVVTYSVSESAMPMAAEREQ